MKEKSAREGGRHRSTDGSNYAKKETDQENENENTLWKWGYKKLYHLTKHRNK